MRRQLAKIGLAALCVSMSAQPSPTQEVRPASTTPPLGARAPITATTADERLQGIRDVAVRASVVATIVAAGERGLPTEPLVTKALEGVEKGAQPARIETAVRALAGRLATASQALAPVISQNDIVTGANALGAGVPASVLQKVREVSGGRSTAVALAIVAQLTARGVPAEQAGAAVAVLVKRGAGHAQLDALQRAVQQDLAVGVSPSTALDLRARALTSALPPTVQPPAAGTADLQSDGNRASPTPRRKP